MKSFLEKKNNGDLDFQLKKKFSVEFLNWLYNENPNGKAIINNIYEDGKIIAHFALVPIKVMFENKTYKMNGVNLRRFSCRTPTLSVREHPS